MKTCIIDVGGGLRDIYGAGVLDTCLDQGIHFDAGIGVSAGSANLASFFAGQRGRNFVYYARYALRPEYMSMRNYLRSRSLLDLDYVYGTLSNRDGEYPLDYPALAADPAELLVVATDAKTGKAKYFTKADLSQDRYDIFKASCALPVLCRPYPIGGRLYYDGALGDPVPVEKALALGCDRLVVILTRPTTARRAPGKDPFLAGRLQRKYPLAARSLRLREQRYNRSVFLAQKLAAQGKALVLAPASLGGMDTLKRDRAALERLYQMGLEDGKAVKGFLEQ